MIISTSPNDKKEEDSVSSKQKELVQSTFKLIVPISEAAADIFYKKLFELDPMLRPLFKGDTKERQKINGYVSNSR